MSDSDYTDITTYDDNGEPISTGNILVRNVELMADSLGVNITTGIIDRATQYVDPATKQFATRGAMSLVIPTEAPWVITGIPPNATVFIDDEFNDPIAIEDGELDLGELDAGIYDIEVRAPTYLNTRAVLEVE